MTRISFLALLLPGFFLCATLGCSDSSTPERKEGKTAITDREENLAKEKGDGKFMRPRGLPGDTGNKDKDKKN
jgi:hypothetical protein